VTWEALLAPALARDAGGWDMGELRARIARGRAQLWLGERSAVVTELVRAPGGDEINCWLAGGDGREIVAMAPRLEAFGRARGCRWATLSGRIGWLRLLKPHGYALHENEIRKGL
jgi:hypothetical protein